MKRFLISLLRILKTGTQNFVRNSWLSTAATAIMVVTLSIVLATFIANFTFSKMIKNITDKIVVSVYLQDGITDQERKGFENELHALPNVESITYITKEQALAAYREQNKDNLELLNAISLTDNPLPASLQIATKDPNKLSEITHVVESSKNTQLQSEKPSYSGKRKQAIDRIVSIARFFRIGGVASSIVFAVISVLIIFNTIRMAIFNRRDEIEIMKLIGATRRYIRGPFLVEASLYGLIAGAITIAISCALILGQADNIATYVPEALDAKALFERYAVLFGLGVIALGIFIGVASSMLATKRYLRAFAPRRRLLRRKRLV